MEKSAQIFTIYGSQFIDLSVILIDCVFRTSKNDYP